MNIFHKIAVITDVTRLPQLGLIKLAQPIRFSQHIQPVKLPENCDELDIPEAMRAIGSGKTQINQEFDEIDGLVRHVALETVDLGSHPILKYRSYLKSAAVFFTVSPDNTFRSTLGGDSGGPLMRQSDGVQCGIIVGFFECSQSARYSYQEFTKIAYFFDWISHETGLRLPKCKEQALAGV